jgi:hypothetical protein
MRETQQKRHILCNPSDIIRKTTGRRCAHLLLLLLVVSFFLGGNDGNARHLRIVHDFRELDRHETVVDEFSERVRFGRVLASGRLDNVVIGQYEHTFQLHVENALARSRPEQFRHVQRDNVLLGGGDGNLVRKLAPVPVRPVQLVNIRTGYQVG